MNSIETGSKVNIVLTENFKYYDEYIDLLVCPGLRDHIFLIKKVLEHRKIHVTTSVTPIDGAINLVFEGLELTLAKNIAQWCRETKNMIVLIQSEHIDFGNEGELRMNGKSWWDKEPKTNTADDLTVPFYRFASQIVLLEYVSCYLFIGDSVDCNFHSKFTPQISHLHLNFPLVATDNSTQSIYEYDFFFSVPNIENLTEFRKEILQNTLNRFKVLTATTKSLTEWLDFANSAKYLLHVPKSEHFSWPSSMRLWLGGVAGRYTVSIFEQASINDNFVLFPFAKTFDDVHDTPPSKSLVQEEMNAVIIDSGPKLESKCNENSSYFFVEGRID
jgi:hypothetical protein